MDLDQVCPPTSQSGSRQECSCEEFWEKIQGNVCGFFFCWAKDTTRILVNSLWEDEDLEFEGGWSSEVSPPTEVPVRTTSPSCHWSEWKCFQNGCRQRQPFHHRTLRTNRLRKDPWPQTQKSLLWTKHFPFFLHLDEENHSPDRTRAQIRLWNTGKHVISLSAESRVFSSATIRLYQSRANLTTAVVFGEALNTEVYSSEPKTRAESPEWAQSEKMHQVVPTRRGHTHTLTNTHTNYKQSIAEKFQLLKTIRLCSWSWLIQKPQTEDHTQQGPSRTSKD